VLLLQYFTVKMSEGIVATSYKPGDKFFIDPAKLLPLERFLPQPKGAPGRGGAGGRGEHACWGQQAAAGLLMTGSPCDIQWLGRWSFRILDYFWQCRGVAYALRLQAKLLTMNAALHFNGVASSTCSLPARAACTWG
jgi:hypothetical protein